MNYPECGNHNTDNLVLDGVFSNFDKCGNDIVFSATVDEPLIDVLYLLVQIGSHLAVKSQKPDGKYHLIHLLRTGISPLQNGHQSFKALFRIHHPKQVPNLRIHCI